MTSKVKKLELIAKKPSRVKSKKVVIDTEIVNSRYKHLSNSVVYGLFKDDSDLSTISDVAKEACRKARSDVCFYALMGEIRASKKNRMFFKLTTTLPSNSNPPLLTIEEGEAWLTLSKKYKLLPPYINEKALVASKNGSIKGTFIIDLDKDMPASLLYIYLSTIRNIREDPGLPKAVLYLVNELGMNFFLAYVFASLVVINGAGHHILNVNRAYGLANGTASMDTLEERIEIPIGTAIGLQRILNDIKKHDKRSLREKKGYGFNCANTIDRISNIAHKVPPSKLFDKNIIAATMSKTDAEAAKCLNKPKPKIQAKHKEANE